MKNTCNNYIDGICKAYYGKYECNHSSKMQLKCSRYEPIPDPSEDAEAKRKLMIMQEIVRNLWDTRKYLDDCIQMLVLGENKEECFKKSLEKFNRKRNYLEPEDLEYCIGIVREFAPGAEPQEIADMLNVDIKEVKSMEGRMDNE